eukprot:s4875_g1.t1
MATDPGSSSSEEAKNNLWSLLPSFDPSTDDVREYTQKVRFLHGVCPPGQRGMLAPRLAMLCKGTAWNQVRNIPAEKLTSADNGVSVLLEALATWEESAEMVTFEKFERALYKVLQKSDESTMSFTNRLNVAFDDLGDKVKVSDFKAFVLLRQSCLSSEDKRKILTMTGGTMETKEIDKAMRALSTKVLTSANEQRKKVYPTNFVEEDPSDSTDVLEPAWHVASHVNDEEYDDSEVIEQLASQGDADALVIQTFESDLEDLFQSTPDLQSALVSYQEARLKLSEKKKYRGFWPTSARAPFQKGKGKGKKGPFKGGGKSSLLERIARTHCKLCGERGHWRAECPSRNKESANVVMNVSVVDEIVTESQHVLVESLDDDTRHDSSRFASVQSCLFAGVKNNGDSIDNRDKSNGVSWKEQAVSFLSHRLSQRKPSATAESPELPADTATHAILSATTDGSFAVLDTGASRSVVGSDLVQSLLKDLPADVRSAVKQCPSHVGFRFGNNQVSYSHYQLRIPITGVKQRIWLLIEVVKGATPFLLSIHAMKCLGAQIDLEGNQVYLKVLKRSLDIQENSNGLYMVRLRDLCKPCPNMSACAETVFHSQLVSETVKPPCDSKDRSALCHAQPSRYAPDHQGDFRASDGKLEGLVVSSGKPCRDPQQFPARGRGTIRSDDAAAFRSPPATKQDRRDCPSLAAISQPQSSCVLSRNSSGLRSGMGSCISSDISGSLSECLSTSKPCDEKPSCSLSTDSAAQCPDDAISEQSSGDPACPSQSSQHRELGTEVHQLGKEVARDSLPRGLREGSILCSVDHGPIQFIDTTDERFPAILPDTPAHGVSSMSEAQCSLVEQDSCALLLSSFITDKYEQNLMTKALDEIQPKGSIDLLEVYAEPDSRLAQAVRDLGGKSMRFTREDGDLSTLSGQCKLLRWVLEYKPKHLWLAPECLPWCAWSRFNQNRSLSSWLEIHGKQEESRVHLKFCSLLMKIQRDQGRHTHMENPDASQAWDQPELEELVYGTLRARFDQCRMGLRHPQNHKLIKKRTTVRTTSHEMHALLDERFCTGQHAHAQISGACRFRGKAVPVSRFSAYYPSGLAKRIARCILKSQHTLVECPVLHVEDESTEVVERPNKRAKIHEHVPEETMPNVAEEGAHESHSKKRVHSKGEFRSSKLARNTVVIESGHPWAPVFKLLRSSLPRVGAREFRAGDVEYNMVQGLCPEMNVQFVKACKGVERYLLGESHASIRRTVVLGRFNHKIQDLGQDDLSNMSQNQQRRRAVPSHIMICVFGIEKGSSSSSSAHPAVPVNGEVSTSDEVPEMPAEPSAPERANVPDAEPNATLEQEPESRPLGTLQPWTPAPVSQSGPMFEQLSNQDKSLVRKLHHNLGHPTAERLSRHLAYQGAKPEVIAGAKDYQCSACVERRPPKQGVPGALKPSREFNDMVGIDGFEWSNEHIKAYVLSAVDETTRFHLGRRTVRDSHIAQRCFSEFWLAWAGSPQCLYFDAAGEFLAQPWQQFLQSENIQHRLTATAWQRGQVERHGGIVKEMLNRMNQQQVITNFQEFDLCLQQCFRAKNSLSIIHGYSPEQCVLGKATKLPASAVSDEESTSHLLAEDSGNHGEQFRIALNRRQLAREAFVKTENSQAIRRALLRKSQGEIINWQPGQLCMYWSKRDAPNMTEQGRWVGPAQVVMQESRSIVWISYLNRLLRCARENLRPVSLREFHSIDTRNLPENNPMLERRARELAQQLQDRSGTFQFRDLSLLEGPPPESNDAAPNAERSSQNSGQPEEEPLRRESIAPEPPVLLPHEVPIPDTPMGSENGEEDETPNENENDVPQLDGHGVNDHNNSPGYSPASTPVEHLDDAGVIYNASLIEPALDGGDCIFSDDETLWKAEDNPEEDCCTFEFLAPVQQLHQYRRNPKEAIAMLASAAKKSHSEVTYKNLTTEEKAMFDVAKQKELKCWLDTNTVKSILKSRVHPSRILGSRWVLTWKMCDVSPSGFKAKARLVVRGYQDPQVGLVQTDSPTLSRDARMVLLQTVSSQKWRLQNFDIRTAFLRGKSDGRELAMHPVPELKALMGLRDDQVCLLEGNAYGRVDAPLLFYKELRKQLESLHFEVHPLDNCLFLLRNPENPEQLDGILGCHVDDGIGGGNHRYEAALDQLQKVLPFGTREYGKFRFTGLDLEQLPDYSIKISQSEYIHKIPSLEISKTRRSERDASATAQEVQSLRALCGSLQYAAVHSRPDIATKVAFMQKSIPQAKVHDLLEANRVLKEAKEFAHTSLFVRPLPFRELTFASFGDASFASESNLKAQQGLFVVACTPELAKNQTSDFSPISWATKQIGRVVRSTLSAEAYAMSSSVDKLNWIRCIWGVIQSPKFQWQHPEVALQGLPKALLITDCKSLYDLMT